MRKVTAILLLCVSALFAEVPNEITYQGRLREYGQPVTGTRTMNFKIYHTATGPGLDWESGNKNVTVSSGAFTCIISPNIDWLQEDYWIETVVSGKTLAPREKLTAQVYALHSKTAEDIAKSAGSTVSFTIGGERKAKITSGGELSSLMNGTTFYMVPRGAIIMWSGSTIPIGWALCDGNNGTPDLRGRFVVGYNTGDSDYNAIALTGGEKTHILSINEMTSHNHGGVTGGQSQSHIHSGTTGNGGSHTHDLRGSWDADGSGWASVRGRFDNPNSNTVTESGSHTHAFNTGTASQDHSHSINTAGGGRAFENRPPYFVLAFIMKL